MSKVRGFEKISMLQYIDDFQDYTFLDGEINSEVIEPLYDELKKPKRSTAMSAGYDVFSPMNLELYPEEEIKLPTGFKAYMQPDNVLLAFPRSGHGFKYYVRLANTIGVVDSDYYDNDGNEGHIWIKIRNEGDKVLNVNKGEAIAQLIFMPYLLVDGDSFDGDKRVGGFGSTNGAN